MGGVSVSVSQTDVTANVVPSALIPILISKKIYVTTSEPDQTVVEFTPDDFFYLQSFSLYVWDMMASSMVIFGEASLESPPGTKLYTCQLTSMGMGRDKIMLSPPLTMPPSQTIRLVCTPSEPIECQTWQGNIVGAI